MYRYTHCMPVAFNELVYQNEKLPGNLLLFAKPLIKLCFPSSLSSVAGLNISVTTQSVALLV